jgi:hypothetical protein
MMKLRPQKGYLFESNGSIHIRFYAHEDDKRRQRSVKLCVIDSNHPSADAPSVLALAESFMAKINRANAANESRRGHSCPLCGKRCERSIDGSLAKRELHV